MRREPFKWKRARLIGGTLTILLITQFCCLSKISSKGVGGSGEGIFSTVKIKEKSDI